MASLPDPQIYYRPTGAADDAWELAASSEIQLVANEQTDICCVKASAINKAIWVVPAPATLPLKRVVRPLTTVAFNAMTEYKSGTDPSIVYNGDGSVTFTCSAAARAWNSTSINVVAGRTYAMVADIAGRVGVDTNEGFRINLVSTGVGEVADGLYVVSGVAATTGATQIRFGIGMNSNRIGAITVKSYAVYDITDISGFIDERFAVATAMTLTPKYAFPGGSGTAAIVSTQTATAAEFSKWSEALLIGDSFANDASDWPKEIERLLNNLCAISGNAGGRLSTVIVPAGLALIANGATSTVLQGGINDIIADASLASMQTAVEEYVMAALARSMSVIVCTVAPFKNSSSWSLSRQAAAEAYNTWLLSGALGASVRIANIYSALGGPDPDMLSAGYDVGDGLHPNAAGSTAIAETIIAEMYPAPVAWNA